MVVARLIQEVTWYFVSQLPRAFYGTILISRHTLKETSCLGIGIRILPLSSCRTLAQSMHSPLLDFSRIHQILKSIHTEIRLMQLSYIMYCFHSQSEIVLERHDQVYLN